MGGRSGQLLRRIPCRAGFVLLGLGVLVLACCGGIRAEEIYRDSVRFATFNASLNRGSVGALILDLNTPNNVQAKKVAEVIQRIRPDVLLLNEFDFDEEGEAAGLFQTNYLGVSQNGFGAINYPYRYLKAVNTGVPSGYDFDNDGDTNGPEDAYGYGSFAGQYGMMVYSMLPINTNADRTFQTFLWKDMPDAMLPRVPGNGETYLSAEELDVFRLSSKSHWDIPVVFGESTIHFLVAHPTPPVFDGAEDRNGRRNHDEIRLIADYIDPSRGSYLYDDSGTWGGLATGSCFVIAGDMNADPFDGDSTSNAAVQLTGHPLINSDSPPSSAGGEQRGSGQGHTGSSALDTAGFGGSAGNLRVDYVLPSETLEVLDSGVFWPGTDEAGYDLLSASDHRMVWIEVRIALRGTLLWK